jgi:hypothetical protein
VLTFKEYLLKEFRIPGPKPEKNIFPGEISNAMEKWFVFKKGNQFTLDKSPCLGETTPVGVFTFSPFFKREEGVKFYSAAQLQLFTKESRVKKSLLHLARGKMVEGVEENYRAKFLSEMISKTVQTLEKTKPSIIVDIESTADFNKSVLSGYKAPNVLGYNSILKNNFNYIASRYTNPSVVRDQLMVDTVYLKGPETGQPKPYAEIISLAYVDMLKDIREGKEIKKKERTTTGETKLSIDLIASVLSSNYIDNAVAEFSKTIKKGIPAAELYGQDQINKWVKKLKDSRTVKEFLLPNDFFIFDKTFWQNPSNNNIVILDDNINSHKTFIEINKRVKLLNPKADITWVVGIKFEGVSEESCPKCDTQQKSLPSEK